MAGKRKNEAKRWLQQAVHDLKAAHWNMRGTFYDTACFVAQQAAVKALKSLLYYLGARRTALMTHSLCEMVQEAAKQVSSVAALLEEARMLDLHYIPARYPNGLPSGCPHDFYGKKMADNAVRASQQIVDAVREHYRSQGEEELLTDEG